MRSAGRDPARTPVPLAEKLLFPVVQRATEAVHRARWRAAISAGDQVSLGNAPAPFHPHWLEEQAIALADLNRHLYLAGATGSGKSFAILILLKELIRLQQGFCVIDVHGDLTRMLLAHLARLAADPAWAQLIRARLVFIDPFDPVWALGYNVLGAATPQLAYQLVGDMLARLKGQWGDSWGPRLEEILRNTLLTLALQGRPLADVPRFLVDAGFRRATVSSLADPVLKSYWLTRFEPLSENAKLAAVQPVLNKVAPLVDDLYLRHIFAQSQSRLSFRHLMDQGKFVLVNLAKGVAGANARQFGALIVGALWAAALSRGDVPEAQRRLFVLVADEFQNFLSYDAPFEEILSESRKYQLGLVMAHQNLSQLDAAMRDAIFGNAGSLYFFRLGFHDAPHVARAFAERVRAQVADLLLSLHVGQAVQRETDGDFRVVQLHHVEAPTAPAAAIQALKEASFAQYYLRRTDVDRQLAARLTEAAPAEHQPQARIRTQPQRHQAPSGSSVWPDGEL
jgi:hypothetical protein